MKNTVLITGGCGFIGLNLVSSLLEKTEWTIHVLDNLSTGKQEHLERLTGYSSDRIHFFKGDIRKVDEVQQAMKNSTFVVHLAAQTDVMTSIEHPLEDAQINILGTINVLQAAIEAEVQRFVFASSAAPLGEQTPPVHEGMVAKPLSGYGASKLSGEAYCSCFAATHDITTVALRFSNVYGPYSYHKGSVIAAFIKDMISGRQSVIYGDGAQTRDFIHAQDIAHAIYLSLTKQVDNSYSLYQIGSGQETTINQVYTFIAQQFLQEGIASKTPQYIDKRPGEIYRNYCSIQKIKKELGFSPSIPLTDGIEETIQWFLQYNEQPQLKNSIQSS